MKKEKLSLTCNVETIARIDEVAKQNKSSRSEIGRMLLDMIHYLPPEKLKETSPVPGMLGLKEVM